MTSDNPNPYADIIDLPHHVSKRHPQMPMEKRAAQFSPFAAMVGHDATIWEATESVGGTNPKASQNHQIIGFSKWQLWSTMTLAYGTPPMSDVVIVVTHIIRH